MTIKSVFSWQQDRALSLNETCQKRGKSALLELRLNRILMIEYGKMEVNDQMREQRSHGWAV